MAAAFAVVTASAFAEALAVMRTQTPQALAAIAIFIAAKFVATIFTRRDPQSQISDLIPQI